MILGIKINKKTIKAVIIFIFITLTAVISCFITSKISAESKNILYKTCIGHSLNQKSVSINSVKIPSLSHRQIFSFVLPVFNPEKPTEYKNNTLKKEDSNPPVKEEKVTIPKEKNYTEKSVISKSLAITNATEYTPDIRTLISKKDYDATGENVKVLIMHTHGCETYSDNDGNGLGDDNGFRTTNTENNVTEIGEIIEKELKSYGINVIHDKTLCDYPEYNKSYMTALRVIDGYLEKYPSIEFVFDIHRDAIETKDGLKTKLTCNINGEKCAQAMIVCGSDIMLEHEKWQENLSLALKIQQKLETDYPGLMRPLNLREERFNMHKTTGSLIFEIGTHANTMDEAKKGALYLSRGIAEVLGGKKQ